eukprot:11203924-Lingulodinium_polyedra.AAC.1
MRADSAAGIPAFSHLFDHGAPTQHRAERAGRVGRQAPRARQFLGGVLTHAPRNVGEVRPAASQ